MKKSRKAYEIKVSGLVQGVGFRPFIYRIAHDNGIFGWVENNLRGVVIHAEGDAAGIERFLNDITLKAPPAAMINTVDASPAQPQDHAAFIITKSSDDNQGVTEISPDIAVCDDCLDDMKRQPHRIGYPFTNCTNCGPRFTIIKDLPYDRDKTTMGVFEMCPQCRSEYSDVLDRRFHAQPVACNHCGPEYTLMSNGETITGIEKILEKTAMLLEGGKIITIKGLGGFHLMCDATSEETVANLRSRKLREGKPFAVMFRDLTTLEDFAKLTETERQMVTSWRRPIVLARYKKELAPSVCNGFHRLGAMLPYMPFHHQLFEKTPLPAIVLTSGNLSDEPIILKNDEAATRLGKIAHATLIYNRDIHNRTDDSVGFVAGKRQVLIRRSRSYAPAPIRTSLNVDGIFAAGAELTNSFAVGREKLAFLSQYIGDLKNFETFGFYEESVEKFFRLFRVEPKIAAIDLHPDYFSTKFGNSLGIKTISIQHHHAHIASCMAEHGLDEPVIGVAFDGTGLGDDGNIWGGEFLVCDLESYSRAAHFEYIPLPGGDQVTKEPWRTAASYLRHTFGEDFMELSPDFLKDIPDQKLRLIVEMLEKKINTPLSSACGRLFDAVSALINLCPVSTFHAEAPMRLESIADATIKASYSFEGERIISFKKMIREIVADLEKKLPLPVISAKFHNTMTRVVVTMAQKIRQEKGIEKVILSGGSFQNAILLEATVEQLEKSSFQVFTNENIPPNDGGIALGQLVIAAKLTQGRR